MKKLQLLYLSFILLLVGGCTNDISELFDDTPINKDGSIAFRTDSMLTRGIPQQSLTGYGEINLIAYSHAESYAAGKSLYREILLKRDSGTNLTWDYTPHMFWPEERGLSFLAHASDVGYATVKGGEGAFIDGKASVAAPTIEYIVPADVKKQPDLLVTTLLNCAKPENKNITLPMKHALSCVSFCATGLPTMKVKSITLKKVYRKATLKLDDPSITWALDPDSKDFTALEPGIKSDDSLEEEPEDKNYLMTPDGYLMMIPQTLKDASIDVVYWAGTEGTEKTVTHALPTTVKWEPGKKYIYKFGEAAEIVVYYEKYADGTYGFQSKNTDLKPLSDEQPILEAGYGVLSKSDLVSNAPNIRLGEEPTKIPTIKTPAVSGEYSLYAVGQTGSAGTTTFKLPATPAPVDVYFDGNSVPCGKIVPHFGKGVYDSNPGTHAIRTPQQMRNISALTTPSADMNSTLNPSYRQVFSQERDLDFSAQAIGIGGGPLTGSVVDEVFMGTYTPVASKSISNVDIAASGANVGLFSRNNGAINNVILKASSIKGGTQVGGIVGENWFDGVISKPQVIGTAQTTPIAITGGSAVGGIVGANSGRVVGNTDLEVATNVTVAEVSGWVTIVGSDNGVGGIVGINRSVIETVLVNGVLVTRAGLGSLTKSKITVQGGYYVGGIVGENWREIKGNRTTGAEEKNIPDVAGVVEIRGDTGVGGVAGVNAGSLNSVNVGPGRSTAIIIEGTDNVGGVAGLNNGTLEVGTAFISARGNISITGNNHVGGIAGYNDIDAAKLQNCFVSDFQAQDGSSEYYAPQITCKGGNVGGIVGSNAKATITGCGVFSTSGKTLAITATNNAGGISGYNGSGGVTTDCSVIGRVTVNAKVNSGGLSGGNFSGTMTEKSWIGSSDVGNLLAHAQTNLKLPITAPSSNYGTPIVTGDSNIGGIAGLNSGLIKDITLADNIVIGRPDDFVPNNVNNGSNWVGGIVGGNSPGDGATNGVVSNCFVKNEAGKIITIRGSASVGGIAGLNNGLVTGCGVSGSSAAPLKIIGLGTLGGIIGQNGGHSDLTVNDVQLTGNDFTAVKNSSVTGYVTIEGNSGGWGMAIEVGGIIGLNGPNKDHIDNVDNCVVRGAATGSITISVGGTAGGIAGTNSGNINKSSVQNATIASKGTYAGGIAGESNATAAAFAKKDKYRSDINDCKVYSAVTVTGYAAGGALIGYLNSASTTFFEFGSSATPNLVNSSGVNVNGTQPTQNNSIVGHVTTDPNTAAPTIWHTVKVVP